MTRQLTVKLKFEIEEEGGRVTALLRVPDHAPLMGIGASMRGALADLFVLVARNETLLDVLAQATICAVEEALLGALWTP